MNLSMYQASIPVCMRMFRNLVGILEKARANAEARGIEPEVLLNARLFPDMFPLVRQVQVATDIGKRGAERLAGDEVTFVEDTETSFGELIDRVTEVLQYMDGLSPEQIDGKEDEAITFKLRGQDVTFSGREFLLNFVLPNIYFHITTAYNILRHNGVELGKPDYLGQFAGVQYG
jgi:hypothetical protein